MEVEPERFGELVGTALDSIPPELGKLMQNVAVFVEDWPTREQLAGRPGTLLGLYEGIALTQRSPLSYAGVMPDRITIFRQTICAGSDTEDEVVRQVRRTVVHEIAHHFGIDDERLHALGYG